MTKADQNLTNLVNKYINDDLLDFSNIETSTLDMKDYEQSINQRLCACKWSKRSQFDAAKEYTATKVKATLEKQLPFIFCFAFGGYKHWWAPTYPETDWAEIFNIKYMVEYILPIAETYKSGVTLEYESEEVALSMMNNTPQIGMDKYTESFRNLLSYIKQNNKLPIEFNYILAKEQYSKDALIKRMLEFKPEVEKRFDILPDEEKEIRLKRAESNILWVGDKDLTKLTENERKEFIYNARILNETFIDVDYELRGESYFEKENLIPFLGTYGLGAGGELWLHLLSTKSSLVDFWAGIGILEIREDRIIPKIISKTQFDKISGDLKKVDIDNPKISKISKNYSWIYVYKGILPF